MPVEGIFRNAGLCCQVFSGESGCFFEDCQDVGFCFVFKEGVQKFGVLCIGEAVQVVSAASGFCMNFYDSFCCECAKLVCNRPAGCTDCFDDFVELSSRVFCEVGGYHVRQGGDTRGTLFCGLAVSVSIVHVFVKVLFC